MVKWPVQAGAVNDTDIAEELVAEADTPVGAPGTDVFDLPYPSNMATAPEASAKRVLTDVQSNPNCAVRVKPSSSLTSNKDIAPEAGSVIIISSYY
jgi:hypothetical protein